MRVGDLFGHSVPSSNPKAHPDLVSANRVGLEIELEGVGRRNRNSDVAGWNIIGDGSLRNDGVEFVFDRPSGGLPLIKRLQSFDKWLSGCKPLPVCSERTSVHVHVDVRDMEWKEVWDMIILYSVVEPFLFKVCGEHRGDNIYSLSLLKGEQQVELITNLREERSAHQWLTGDEIKYASVNFNSMRRFGSLEFRSHEGTYDTARILYWVNCLLSLREYVLAGEFEVEEIPKLMSELGPRDFLQDVFGESFEGHFDHTIERMMFRSALLAEDILHQFSYRSAAREVVSQSKGDLLEQLYATAPREQEEATNQPILRPAPEWVTASSATVPLETPIVTYRPFDPVRDDIRRAVFRPREDLANIFRGASSPSGWISHEQMCHCLRDLVSPGELQSYYFFSSVSTIAIEEI